MEEEWRDIKGYEGIYQVSNIGRVKSLCRLREYKGGRICHLKGKMITPSPDRYGYLHLCLSKNNIVKTFRVHMLVANAFIPNPNKKCEINHIDGNKVNNCVQNLEWCTQKENVHHSIHVLGHKIINPSGEKAKGNKPIALINAKTGERIRTFYSRTYASKVLGYNAGYVGDAANYGFAIGNYKFEYLNKHEEDNF